MKPLEYPLLADENIHPEVIAALRARGRDVKGVVEEGLGGRTDVEILRRAVAEGRVVLSHDSDFGMLAIHAGEPILGIIYLRPGHIRASVVLSMIDALDAQEIDVRPRFIVVAEKRGETLRVRLR